jgi:glycosyltransferase involved in cell wall biosynthesis
MASPGRVLIVDENLPVPFDRRVWMESCALRDAGYEVVVVCPAGREAPAPFEVLDGVRIHRHPLSGEAAKASEYPREYAQALWHELRLAVGLGSPRPFDVVHLCNPPDILFLVGGLLRARHGTAVLFDQHDLSPELYEAKFKRRDVLYRALRVAERLTFATADVVVATNESYRSLALARGGMSPDDVFVVRNGCDLSWFAPTAGDAAYKRGRRYLVGYVGTMAEQEGIDHLLRAARLIVRDWGRDDVAFTIIGGGPAVGGLRDLSRELGLDDVVEFTGRVSDDELLDRLSTCDVCVNPDPKTPFNDVSTMTKIMDYMALSKPMVQFDLTEGRRSAADASLYARPHDEEHFARLIVELLDDPERRAVMGSIGRERMERELQWRHQVPELLAAYERALQKRRQRADGWAWLRRNGNGNGAGRRRRTAS